jgi:hypothetical protein
MNTYFAARRMTSSGHLLDGRLGGYCRGLVPQVLRVTDYGPKFYARLVPSSGKWVGNHTPPDMAPPLQAEEEGSPT